jgi:uncharacterized protein YndB with AHSA1/START domain
MIDPTTVQVTTPTERELAMTRRFAAPSALVFEALTVPELVRRWLLGPDGWSMPVCDIDLRVGGSYRYVWRNDADGTEFGMEGVYQEIDAPRRIVHTEVFEGSEAWVTNHLVEERGVTTLTMTMRFASQEARDAALATGMASGVEASFRRLEERVLADRHGSASSAQEPPLPGGAST